MSIDGLKKHTVYCHVHSTIYLNHFEGFDRWPGPNVKFLFLKPLPPPEGLDPWEGCHPKIMTSKTKTGIH